MKTLKAGIIGLRFGRHHTRILSEIPDVDVIGVSDVDPKKIEVAHKYGMQFFGNYMDLLDCNLDFVLVIIPTKQHCTVSMDVIHSGAHCFVEKPIAYSLDEATKMIKAADINGVKLAIGHIETFNPAVTKLKEVLNKGVLGDIKYMSSRRVGPFVDRVLDVGIMIDSATHDVGVIRYLLEKDPIDIYSKCWSIKNEKGDYAIMVLDYGNMSAGIEVNWFTPHSVRTLDITGTKGIAHLDFMTQEVDLFTEDYEMKLNIKQEEPLKLELNNFIHCIQNNINPLVTGTDGFEILKIVKQAGAR